MYCGDDVSSVVFDIGQYNIRSGYSGEDCPRTILPSVVGICPSEEKRSDGDQIMQGDGDGALNGYRRASVRSNNVIVGSSRIAHRRDGMEIQSIFDENNVLQFELLDEIIEESLIKNLRVNIQETPLLFTEPAIHNKDLRMKLTEYMFEKYKIPALFLVKDPVLTAFSCGKSSALILDSGHKQTVATPVNDGYALLKCIIKHDIGGEMITKDLFKAITEKKKQELRPRYTFKKKFYNVDGAEVLQITDLTGTDGIRGTTESFANWSQMEVAREIKEDWLNVSEEQLQNKLSEQSRVGTYELPDGSQLQMNAYDRQSITEKLFQNQSSLQIQNDPNFTPEISGFSGVHQMVVEAISKSDIDIRRDLFTNIITSGGNSMLNGFQDRLIKQLPEISPQNVKVKVISGTDRRFQPWIGGSILSSLGSFQQMWMSRQEYEEHGAIMIERKCP